MKRRLKKKNLSRGARVFLYVGITAWVIAACCPALIANHGSSYNDPTYGIICFTAGFMPGPLMIVAGYTHVYITWWANVFVYLALKSVKKKNGTNALPLAIIGAISSLGVFTIHKIVMGEDHMEGIPVKLGLGAYLWVLSIFLIGISVYLSSKALPRKGRNKSTQESPGDTWVLPGSGK